MCVCAREPPYEPNPPTSDRCSAPAVAAPLIVLSNGCLASVTGAPLLCAAPMCLPQEEVEAAAGCGAWMRRLSGDRLFSLPAQFPSRGRVDLW